MSEDVTFWEMYRERPGRTAVASFVPILLGLAQLMNGFVHDIPVTHTGAFAVVMAVGAILVTQYHLVLFNRQRLQRELFGDD